MSWRHSLVSLSLIAMFFQYGGCEGCWVLWEVVSFSVGTVEQLEVEMRLDDLYSRRSAKLLKMASPMYAVLILPENRDRAVI